MTEQPTEVLVTQPTKKPTRKVSRGALWSFLGVIAVQALKAWLPDLPPEALQAVPDLVQAIAPAAVNAVSGVLFFIGAYFTKERARVVVVKPTTKPEPEA